jgi:hypothetical protein
LGTPFRKKKSYLGDCQRGRFQVQMMDIPFAALTVP